MIGKRELRLKPGSMQMVPFADLALDPNNPRLPEGDSPRLQSDLMLVFFRDYDLDELAESYVANGFFASESLIVLPDGTVVEGNRRLAALKYLFNDDDAKKAGLPPCDSLNQISAKEKEALQNKIPVQVVKNRNDLAAYLGFRHINGAKEWPSASKARFVYERVEYYANMNDRAENVFKIVGHEIGSNATGARNWYVNYALIRQARDELGLHDLAAKVTLGKFGVWRRLCGDQVYRYIGFDPQAKEYERIQESLDSLDASAFESLLQDIVPDEYGNTILSDSRRASDYTAILAHPAAIQVLRDTRDFDVALLVAEGSPVNRHLEKALTVLSLASASLENDAPIDERTQRYVNRLIRQVDAIDGMVRGILEKTKCLED